ncbi:hypothetical protein PRIEUP_LOCUS388, partial [Pristimantis euphronides]
MLVLGVFLLQFALSEACLLPAVCPPSNVGRVFCCPSFNGSVCGNAQGRGSCVALAVPRTVPDPDVPLDDRYEFPAFYYSHICVCQPNFMGADCGECSFNRGGQNCDRLTPVVRREWRQLTPKEQQTYKAQMHYCKSKLNPDCYLVRTGDRMRRSSYDFFKASYYDGWCYLHYYATKPFNRNGTERYIINYAHYSTAFLTWHKYFMLLLEKLMQICLKDPTFAIVYYDWQYDTSCAVCNDDGFGGNNALGEISPYSAYSSWR